jgi:hypothetical protein
MAHQASHGRRKQRQGVDYRQAVGDDLPRYDGQVQLGQPAAARPGPVAGRPVITMVRGHRVDPGLRSCVPSRTKLTRCRISARS